MGCAIYTLTALVIDWHAALPLLVFEILLVCCGGVKALRRCWQTQQRQCSLCRMAILLTQVEAPRWYTSYLRCHRCCDGRVFSPHRRARPWCNDYPALGSHHRPWLFDSGLLRMLERPPVCALASRAVRAFCSVLDWCSQLTHANRCSCGAMGRLPGLSAACACRLRGALCFWQRHG